MLVCIVGLLYRLILVHEHEIIHVYVCLYKCTNEIDIPTKNLVLTGDQ